ncbi:MAG: acetyl-CoA carboxylase biotin carboxyl carrier protein subunit [Desulfobacteraceae bacterium]|nr:acetyl-CoA carboxylase biotin carboxyl carrier protein subunit [Desulfobacteraceae bacterium]
MDYFLKIRDNALKAHVETQTQEQLHVTIGDARYHVSYARLTNDKILLNINGAVVTAYVQATAEGKKIVIKAIGYNVKDAGSTELYSSSGSELEITPKQITPPMPAVVIQVKVKKGDIVENGQELIVISAMKMQTTLTAPYAGLVSAVNVSEADKVMPGQKLIEIRESKP